MKSPIDRMLDCVEWEVVEREAPADNSMPYATHSGVLNLAGHQLKCYRLNNGMAVFDADDVNALFGVPLFPTADFIKG